MDAGLNWLWQGCVVAFVSFVMLRLLERARANVRYVVCWVALLLIVVLPVLPSLGNTLISLFKDTSLAAAISVPELTFVARKVNTDTFQTIEAWGAAAALYLVTCYLIAAVLRFLERRVRWSV